MLRTVRISLKAPEGCFKHDRTGNSAEGGTHRTLTRDNPVVTDIHVNIQSVKTGSTVGTINETNHDSLNSRLASLNARDFLLVMEGGTKLKVYELRE